jgi:hypothetical protein
MAPPLTRAPTWVVGRTVGLASAGVGAGARRLRRAAEATVAAWLTALVPRVVEAVLDRLDLTALVRDRVDLDALVRSVDLDRVVAGVDLDAAVRRVDVDGILDRVDVDGIVERVDLERVVARLDLAAIVNEVMDEVDLPDVIRESTGSMASETVRAVRLQGIGADARVAALVARVLPLLGRQAGATARDVDAVAGAQDTPAEAAPQVPLPRTDAEATHDGAAPREDATPRDEPGPT